MSRKHASTVLCCLLSILCLPLLLSRCRPDSTANRWAWPPTICVDGELYRKSPDYENVPRKQLDDSYIFIGMIKSICEPDRLPNEHLQSNSAIKGAGIYQSENDLIAALRNGRFELYLIVEEAD